MAKITFIVAEILCKGAVVTSYVVYIIFAVGEITFKVTSMAYISLFVTKITFVVAEIIIKEHVITFSVDKIIFVVDETMFKVAVIIFFQWPISCL